MSSKPCTPQPIQNPVARFFVLGISSGLGLGYMPVAPGSFGSLLGLALGLACLHRPLWVWAVGILFLWWFFSKLADRAARHWGNMDCQKIVSDEVLGQMIAVLGLRHFTNSLGMDLPPWNFVLGCYIAFRLLDIVKPWPARTFDRKPSGFGIVTDDIVSGVYAAFAMVLAIRIFWDSPL